MIDRLPQQGGDMVVANGAPIKEPISHPPPVTMNISSQRSAAILQHEPARAAKNCTIAPLHPPCREYNKQQTVSTTFQGPSVGTPASHLALPKLPSAIGGAYKLFPFGEIIRPERDLIGGYTWEHERQQLCVDQDTLKIISRLSKNADHGPWKMGRSVHRRVAPCDRHRVVSTYVGWRVLSRVKLRDGYHALGHCLVEMPVLFPSANVAIAVSELFIANRSEELGYLTWFHNF
jgi:hypothetical protein